MCGRCAVGVHLLLRLLAYAPRARSRTQACGELLYISDARKGHEKTGIHDETALGRAAVLTRQEDTVPCVGDVCGGGDCGGI